MSEESLMEIQKEWHGSLKYYLIGFSLSVFLTAVSFFLVMTKLFTGTLLIIIISALAIIQGGVQVRFFLHVGEEPKPRWESGIFFFMILVLLIIIVGSVWIMYDLNDRVMKGM